VAIFPFMALKGTGLSVTNCTSPDLPIILAETVPFTIFKDLIENEEGKLFADGYVFWC